jgi:signal recognition particle receptor subunit alpha
VRTLFTSLYRDQLKRPNSSVFECHFDPYFDRQIQELEKLQTETKGEPTAPSRSTADKATLDQGGHAHVDEPPPSIQASQTSSQKPFHGDDNSTHVTSLTTPETSRPTSPAVNSRLLTAKHGPGGRGSRRARKAAATTSSAPVSSGDESPARKAKGAPKATKKMRKWDADGMADEDTDVNLDYSSQPAEDGLADAKVEAVDSESWGRRTANGEFMLKDIGEEMDAILESESAKRGEGTSSSGIVGSSLGAIEGLFRKVVGNKILTKEDLEKPLKGMEDHLLKKNVAREAAVRLCQSVEQDLLGTKTGNFTSIESTIHQSMEKALRKILTPTSPLDLLREIQALHKKRPYVMSIVGVNGVGKSTNLSKICYFLLQNRYKVLIAAGDTFRSGAVEQLRVHVRNLKELTERQQAGSVDLYEKGYGKDAAVIARDAVSFAASNGFDVVLIDTAGRRHNDQRLMSSLEKFANLAQPDKILMVGEALVGTDSVQQARHFDAAFGPGRSLDGFIISKCDTVGDMVGTIVSMVHATGIPVLFLGTGQHYSDLRTLKVESVVQLLMRP